MQVPLLTSADAGTLYLTAQTVRTALKDAGVKLLMQLHDRNMRFGIISPEAFHLDCASVAQSALWQAGPTALEAGLGPEGILLAKILRCHAICSSV